MKKFVLLLAVLLAAGLANAQFGPGSGRGSMAPPPPKKQPTTRSLSGTVLNQNDDPLSSAVVYLKDTRTLAVRTYISNPDGSYLFNGLSPNQDYELYAEYQGERSSRRTLSAFDSRAQANINLHINVKPKK
jgi:hypothetical protein